MADLSLGILIDIVDEEWMRDTLPDDGTSSLFYHFFKKINSVAYYVKGCSISMQVLGF